MQETRTGNVGEVQLPMDRILEAVGVEIVPDQTVGQFDGPI